MDYILDGEIHILSHELAYAGVKIEKFEKSLTISAVEIEFSELVDRLAYKYKEYVEKSGFCLPDNFSLMPFCEFTNRNIQLIFRPPIVTIDETSTIAIKFYRLPNDMLNNKTSATFD